MNVNVQNSNKFWRQCWGNLIQKNHPPSSKILPWPARKIWNSASRFYICNVQCQLWKNPFQENLGLCGGNWPLPARPTLPPWHFAALPPWHFAGPAQPDFAPESYSLLTMDCDLIVHWSHHLCRNKPEIVRDKDKEKQKNHDIDNDNDNDNHDKAIRQDLLKLMSQLLARPFENVDLIGQLRIMKIIMTWQSRVILDTIHIQYSVFF